jgi:quinol monooxygenase YgiN
MAFLLHVDFHTASPASSAVVLEQLAIMASVQGPHAGMVTYAFFPPHADPCHLEFVGVYADEANFWAHATDPKVRRSVRCGVARAREWAGVVGRWSN